jgi:hypothetical protein
MYLRVVTRQSLSPRRCALLLNDIKVVVQHLHSGATGS